MTVIVEIGRGYTHAPALVDQPALNGHIRKSSVAVVPEKAAGGPRQFRVIEQLERRPVDQKNIH